MFGEMGMGKPYYRCSATRPDYATPTVAGHPPTYSIREERILGALDDWLSTLTDGSASTRRSPPCSPPTVRAIPSRPTSLGARRRQGQLRIELDRMLAAIRAGMDPDLATTETRRIRDEIAAADAVIQRWDARPIGPVR